MRFRLTYFFWILMLAFGLMILVVAAQVLTKQNINGLKIGNKEAVHTFTINNRLQELVNLSFALNSEVLSSKSKASRTSLIDSLNMLGYNSAVLQKINNSGTAAAGFQKLNDFISKQVENSMDIIQSDNFIAKQDSFQKLKIADSVYAAALLLQKKLESNLQSTLNNNTDKSSFLSAYNKVLAIIAIAAVLILCTIIINRHLRQVQLIKQLEAATAAAEKSAAIKDQFLANMSHEIRTPLNAIKGFSQLLSKTNLNEEQRKYTEIINDSSGNLLYIVNDILDISKIEAGKLRINNKEFDIRKILQTTEQLFALQAIQKNLTYSQQVDAEIPDKLWGDPDRLLQILINLISNGLKFTQQGFVKTTVSIQERNDTKVWLCFVIEDTGVGIPPNKQEEVFKRFEQLQPTREALVQGTGLGLSIVKSLATLMDGGITLESEFGKGSTFKVVLPFVIVKEDANNKPKPTLIGNNSQLVFSGSKVLVAEDNKVNQLLITSLLQHYRIHLTIVENGEAALEAVQNDTFDLILMDIQMPVMDGYTATQALREKWNIQTPIVAMTAFVLPGEDEKCRAYGMNDYLAKPIDTVLLEQLLKKYLGSNLNTTKKPNAEQIDFILDLSGGDKGMAIRILSQVKEEISPVKNNLLQLMNTQDVKGIKALLHSMVSSFSPLGVNSNIMKVIADCRKRVETKEPNYNTILQDCIQALDGVGADVNQAIKTVENLNE
jgi:signal transduction histidine kinase/DNA-binding response OmpR family regulator